VGNATSYQILEKYVSESHGMHNEDVILYIYGDTLYIHF